MSAPAPVLTAALRAELDQLCARYPQRRAALLPILHRVQEERGWISREAMEEVAGYLDVPPVEVQGVVSFYPMFRQEPGGRHEVWVCRNISCHLTGAEELLRAIEQRFGVKPGETSADGRFTLRAAQCLGACGYGPMMDVDGRYHEHLTPERAVEILEGLP